MAFVSRGCCFFDCFNRRHDQEFDLAALGFSLHFPKTGKAPLPVQIMRRLHLHGISSSNESGVWPKASRNFLDGFFLRLRTSPRSITMSWS